MFLGVPLRFFLAVSALSAIASAWLGFMFGTQAFLPLVLVYACVLILMRQMTRRDDQALHQFMMGLLMRRTSKRSVSNQISFAPRKSHLIRK